MFLMLTILVLVVSRPNIFFIVADDLDTQYGKWIDYFPEIKNLMSNQGMTFTDAFVSIGLCCPSRTSSLTGRYAHNTNITGNNLPLGSFQKVYDLGIENSTIATWLQDSKYTTVLLGKYLNGYPDSAHPSYIPPGWNEWYVGENDPYKQFNYTLNQNGRLVFYGAQPEDYLQDVITRFAVDFINTTHWKPFFMWMASFCPHRPAAFAPRHANAFSFLQAPRPPSFNDRNLLSSLTIMALDDLYRRRMRSMLAVEDTILSQYWTKQTNYQIRLLS